MQLANNNANPIAKSWDFRELAPGNQNQFGGTEEETRDTFELWGPKYDKLSSASNKDRVKIWNDIFVAYEEKSPDSERTLPR